MNFKSLAVSAVVATTALFGGVAAPAEASTCFPVSDFATICNSYRGTNAYGDVYTVGYSSDDGATTGMTVTCRGSHVVDWQSSNGNMSYDYLDTLAEYFCSI